MKSENHLWHLWSVNMEPLEQGLNFSMCRGQAYNGAGNMAGIIQGATV